MNELHHQHLVTHIGKDWRMIHSGWCATLEDWFDPRRLADDYVPTGFKPNGNAPYPVKGHLYGLDLSDEERAALIAFLRTL